MIKRFALHISFWIISFLIFTKANAIGDLGYVDWVYSSIWYVLIIPVFYLSFTGIYLIDSKQQKNKKESKGWSRIFYYPLTTYVFGMAIIIFQISNNHHFLYNLILNFNFISDEFFIIPEQNKFIILSYYLTFSAFGLLFAGGEYVLKQQKVKDELAREKQLRLEAENRTILQQVNPHFLYNTLNAIYAQAIQGSENVKDSLLTLSELMRYPVSLSSENKWISFQTELAQIKRYIDLQKLRFTNRIKVIVKDKTESAAFNVPPLLLMIPIENAFKHGNLTYASLVEIVFEKVGNELRFFVSNPVDLDKKGKEMKENTKSTGQGLVQLNEGLSLLYGDEYRMELKMNTSKSTHEFTLFLPLKSKKT